MNDTDPPAPLRSALVGYGQMGREIERLAVDRDVTIVERFDVDRPLAHGSLTTFDVAIEFTQPSAVVGNITTLLAAGRAVVVGTTGWLEQIETVRNAVREHAGRVVYASNFSIGVNIFFALVRRAGELFNDHAMYDAAVHEIHHTKKADSPSGTALTAAGILLDTLDRKTGLLSDASHGRIAPELLHVSSQRLGSTIGTHSVAFDSDADGLELVHRAKNRSGFALGALLAARWIVRQPSGLYRFEDIFS